MPRPRRRCVRWGPSSPKKGGLDPHVYCSQMAGWIQMSLGTEVSLGPDHIALEGDPHKKGGTPPQFSTHVYCGQTAEWIKMPLGTEIGLGPGDIVLHGDPAAPKGHRTPSRIFRPCLLWPNGRPSQLLLSTCSTGCMLHEPTALLCRMHEY